MDVKKKVGSVERIALKKIFLGRALLFGLLFGILLGVVFDAIIFLLSAVSPGVFNLLGIYGFVPDFMLFVYGFFGFLVGGVVVVFLLALLYNLSSSMNGHLDMGLAEYR